MPSVIALFLLCSLASVWSNSRLNSFGTQSQNLAGRYSPWRLILEDHAAALQRPDIENESHRFDPLGNSIDDIHERLSVASSLPTDMPPPINRTAPSGFLYFQNFDDASCEGKLMYESGLALDMCLSYPSSGFSYHIGLLSPENCSSAAMVTYLGAGCNGSAYIGQFPIYFNTSCTPTSTGWSYIGSCHDETTVPINFDGVMEIGYEGDSDCADDHDIMQYVNIPVDSCYLGVPPGQESFPFPPGTSVSPTGNFTWDLYSYQFLCDNNANNLNYSIVVFWDSYYCDDMGDNVGFVYLPTTCDIEEVDFLFAPSVSPTESPTVAPSLPPTLEPTESSTDSFSLSAVTSEVPIHDSLHLQSILLSHLSTRETSLDHSASSLSRRTTQQKPTVKLQADEWQHDATYYYDNHAFENSVQRRCVFFSPAPTETPTQEPTLGPTQAPSETPTFAPSTRSPTSFRPSHAPSSTRSPTFTAAPSFTASPSTRSPTPIPTPIPTFSPTNVPTWMPVASPVTILEVVQIVSGLNASEFNQPSTFAQYEIAFLSAIVKSLLPAVVSTTDVYNLLVEAQLANALAYSVPTRKLSGLKTAATSIQSRVTYSLFVPFNASSVNASFYSATSLSNQLTSTINTGDFDDYLSFYSVQYNAPGLNNTNSLTINVLNQSPGQSTSDNGGDELYWWLRGMNLWIIVAVGGAVVLGGIVGLIYYCFYRKNSRRNQGKSFRYTTTLNNSASSNRSPRTRSGISRLPDDDNEDIDGAFPNNSERHSGNSKGALSKSNIDMSSRPNQRQSASTLKTSTALVTTGTAATVDSKNNEDNWFSFDEAFSVFPANNAASNTPSLIMLQPIQPQQSSALLPTFVSPSTPPKASQQNALSSTNFGFDDDFFAPSQPTSISSPLPPSPAAFPAAFPAHDQSAPAASATPFNPFAPSSNPSSSFGTNTGSVRVAEAPRTLFAASSVTFNISPPSGTSTTTTTTSTGPARSIPRIPPVPTSSTHNTSSGATSVASILSTYTSTPSPAVSTTVPTTVPAETRKKVPPTNPFAKGSASRMTTNASTPYHPSEWHGKDDDFDPL